MGIFGKKEKSRKIQDEKKKKQESFLNYEQAKEEFLNQTLNSSKSRNNWVMIAMFSMVIAIISIVGLIYFATRGTIMPYFFEIDRNGTVHKLIVGDYEKQYIPDDELVMLELRHWLENSRWISTDEVIQNNYVEKAFNYSSDKTQEKLKSIYAQEELTKLIKQGVTRDILIESVTKADTNMYNARWTENIYNENGNIINQVGKFGNFKIEIVKPKTTTDLKKNPLGITIVDFNISTTTN